LIDIRGVAAGTKVLCPNPHSTRGEEAQSPPSPSVGKGFGDGVWEGVGTLRPIESLKIGDLVLTHRNRFMPIDGIAHHKYAGEIVLLDIEGADDPLLITPRHYVATALPEYPEHQARMKTARRLRSNATKAERHLWRLIRRKVTGVKFRRQHRIGSFIVDFYSPQIRMVVEVDGDYHDSPEQQECDRYRQSLIEEYDVAFVRMANREVLDSAQAPKQIVEMVRDRKSIYWYNLRWLASTLIRPGIMLHATGRRKSRSVLRVDRAYSRLMICDLTVEGDASYVTEMCTVRSLS
jgi:very-short-patch-repair endonuclease